MGGVGTRTIGWHGGKKGHLVGGCSGNAGVIGVGHGGNATGGGGGGSGGCGGGGGCGGCGGPCCGGCGRGSLAKRASIGLVEISGTNWLSQRLHSRFAISRLGKSTNIVHSLVGHPEMPCFGLHILIHSCGRSCGPPARDTAFCRTAFVVVKATLRRSIWTIIIEYY